MESSLPSLLLPIYLISTYNRVFLFHLDLNIWSSMLSFIKGMMYNSKWNKNAGNAYNNVVDQQINLMRCKAVK
ncbi:hypothetical protein RIF29_33751 [Crotalaria pallida]|uniref:Uncharacterized protein n=1 Tax=Crotalaria pallida TaxID=3830 RepID=A0AAN9E8G2_CROPI